MTTLPIESKKKCWACNSEIVVNQKFCPNCQKWQGYMKYLSISNTTLSLLVALIAVSTAFSEQIYYLLQPIRTSVEIIEKRNTEKPISLEVVNQSIDSIYFSGIVNCTFTIDYSPKKIQSNLKLSTQFQFLSSDNNPIVDKYKIFEISSYNQGYFIDDRNVFIGNADSEFIASRFEYIKYFFPSFSLAKVEDNCFLNILYKGQKYRRTTYISPEVVIPYVLREIENTSDGANQISFSFDSFGVFVEELKD